MNDLDTLEKEEATAYKAQAVSAKFRQQVAYGIGAAMVFGLVSAVAKTLFDAASVALAAPAAAGASVALPVMGIVALGVMGVGLLYLSAKFLSENTLLDQQMQAKQISCATRGKAPNVQPVVAPKVEQFPEVADQATVPAATAPLGMTPTTTISGDRELADTITPRAPVKAANENIPAADWVTQVEKNDTQQARAV